MMILALLGILDMIIGCALAASPYLRYSGNAAVELLAIMALAKGLYSVVSAALSCYYFSLQGWLDIIAGILIFAAFMGFGFSWFFWIGIFMLLKGAHSVFTELAQDYSQ